MADRKKDRPTWVRYSSIGIEFAAAVAGLSFFGLWIDRRYGCEPWGTMIGAGVGVVGGTYNLIRASMAAFKEIEQSERDDKERPPTP